MESLELVVNKECDIINIAKGETVGPGNAIKLTGPAQRQSPRQ
jgi:hypothetical protein